MCWRRSTRQRTLGGTEGFDHPISWYKYFEGGRSWYTGLGHTASSYSEPLFLDHLLGGIEFAAGRAPADLGGTIDANWHKAELATGLSNPISLTVAPSGDVYFVELGGKLKIYHPSTGLTTTAATLNVFAQGEDGLLGIASIQISRRTNGFICTTRPPGRRKCSTCRGSL